jgi:hypothetical protein
VRHGISVVLKAVGAFLIGGVLLAGCGAAPPPARLVTSSVPVSAAPATSASVSAAPAETTTPSPIPTRTAVSTRVAAPAAPVTTKPSAAKTAFAAAPETTSFSGDYYRNIDGNCVHRPQDAATAPAGATARCGDGTYSFSQHRQGTCSDHGGVATWL